jgi:SAM-dependent methyltransferase
MARHGWLSRPVRSVWRTLRLARLFIVVRRVRRRTWRTRTDPVRGRRGALHEEVVYWAEYLSTRGGKYADGYNYRFDPASEVNDPALRELLAAMPQQHVSIIDVGAGPVPYVGYRFPAKRLTVVAVDPLADDYNLLLDRGNLVPPVRTERVAGERLLERFGPDRFDIAYSRNAVDHATDPTRIIEQMVAVVRPGGYLVLRHVRNEAVNQAYVQLHQWNFDERDGAFVIWREGHEFNVTEALAGRAEVTCRRELTDCDWIVCVARKSQYQ